MLNLEKPADPILPGPVDWPRSGKGRRIPALLITGALFALCVTLGLFSLFISNNLVSDPRAVKVAQPLTSLTDEQRAPILTHLDSSGNCEVSPKGDYLSLTSFEQVQQKQKTIFLNLSTGITVTLPTSLDNMTRGNEFWWKDDLFVIGSYIFNVLTGKVIPMSQLDVGTQTEIEKLQRTRNFTDDLTSLDTHRILTFGLISTNGQPNYIAIVDLETNRILNSYKNEKKSFTPCHRGWRPDGAGFYFMEQEFTQSFPQGFDTNLQDTGSRAFLPRTTIRYLPVNPLAH